MKELLVSLAQGLVEKPDAVNVVVDEPNEEGVEVYHLHVDETDMGRVIGKDGRIIKSIREIVRAYSAKNGHKVVVNIEE